MPTGSGFMSGSTDLDAIFSPLGTATKAPDTGLITDGVDISNRYYPLSAPGAVPVTSPLGLQVNGLDLTTIFGRAPSNSALAIFITDSPTLPGALCYPLYMNDALQSTPDHVAYRTGVTIKQVANIAGGGSNPPMSGTYLAWGLVDQSGTPLALADQPTSGTITTPVGGAIFSGVTVLSPQYVNDIGATTVPPGLGIIIGLPPAAADTNLVLHGTFASGSPMSMDLTLRAVDITAWAYTPDDALLNGVTAGANTSSTLAGTSVEFAGPIIPGVALNFQLGMSGSRAWASVSAMQVVSYTRLTGATFTVRSDGLQINMDLPAVQGTSTGTVVLADSYGNHLPGPPITVISILGAQAAFLCYPGASITTYLASLLPIKINGILYTTYPAGLTFPTNSVVELTSPVTQSGALNKQGLQMIFGLVALKYKGGTILPTANQPLIWATSDTGTTYYDAATVQSSIADTGPPYYAGSFYYTDVATANVKTFTAATNEAVPSSISATLDIRTPGYLYTFIDRPDVGQSIATGITCIYPLFANSGSPTQYSASSTTYTTDTFESKYYHGTTSFTKVGLNITLTQTFNTTSPGPLPTVAYNSIGQMLDNAPNIHFAIGSPIISVNTVGTPTGGGNVQGNNLTWVIDSYFSGADWTAGLINVVDELVDADNAIAYFPSIKHQTVAGTQQPGDGTTVNYSSSGPGWPDQTIAFQSMGVPLGLWFADLSTSQGTYFGQGALFMNRKRVHVT